MPLDPEIAAYLEIQKSLPPRSSMTLQQTRDRIVESAARFGGAVLDVPSVRDFTLGALPVREYRVSARPMDAILLYFHGGRFISGGLDSHDRVCRRLALATQCRVVAVDYRLAPEHRFPAAVEDALTAVNWAFGESGRVVVAGDSAGANLATVAAAERRTRVKCQVLIYPMIDATCSLASHAQFGEGFGPSSLDMQRGWDQYIPPGADPRDSRISPLFNDDFRGFPPTLLLTAEYDCLRDEGERYGIHVEQAGNRVEVKRYAGAIHGFLTLTGCVALAREAIEYTGEYIINYTK